MLLLDLLFQWHERCRYVKEYLQIYQWLFNTPFRDPVLKITSCWCTYSVHGKALPHLIHNNVPSLRRHCGWFYHRCFLHQLGPREVRQSKNTSYLRDDTALSLYRIGLHTTLSACGTVVSNKSRTTDNELTTKASSCWDLAQLLT